MNHFASTRTSLRSWRCTTLTAIAGLSCMMAITAHGQLLASGSTAPVTVSLTPAAFLPATNGGSSHTTIATNFDGNAPASPWQISLLSLGRSADVSGQTYKIQMTNISSATMSLPVGTDGQAIWDACQKSPISEVNISLRVAGQIAPAANLPSVHSCTGVSSSSLMVVPGASVIFSGALPANVLAPNGSSISAVVSVCSASYTLEAGEPVTTRHCQVPVTSNTAAVTAPTTVLRGPVRVQAPPVE